MLVSFFRLYGGDLATLENRSQSRLAEKHGIALPVFPSVFSENTQKKFRELVRALFTSASEALVVAHEAMNQRNRKNNTTIELKGELPQARIDENEAEKKVRLLIGFGSFFKA
jgi:hypothetical protein